MIHASRSDQDKQMKATQVAKTQPAKTRPDDGEVNQENQPKASANPLEIIAQKALAGRDVGGYSTGQARPEPKFSALSAQSVH